MRRYPHRASGGGSVSASPPPSPAARAHHLDEPRPRSTSSPGQNPGTVRPPAPGDRRRRALISHDLALVSRSPTGSPSWKRARSSRRRAPRFSAIRCDRAGSWPLCRARTSGSSPSGRGRCAERHEHRRPLQRKRLFRPAPRPATANIAIDVRRGEVLRRGQIGLGQIVDCRALILADYTGRIALAGRLSTRRATWTGRIAARCRSCSSIRIRRSIRARRWPTSCHARCGSTAATFRPSRRCSRSRLPAAYAKRHAPALGRRKAEGGDRGPCVGPT